MESKLSFEPHSLIFKEGERASKLFLVQTGEVLCLKSSKDRLIPVFLAKAGDIIGESAILQNLEYTYSAIAFNKTDLLEIPATSFEAVLATAPQWLVDLTETMVTRFQNTSNLIAENRIIHQSILPEELFPSDLEVEFKRLIN